MVVEVATFTPRPPVSLFQNAKRSLDTVFESLITPTLFAEVDGRGQVDSLRNTTAVLTSALLTNTSGTARTVTFRVRSSRRVTYTAEVTAQAGENWLRLDRTTSTRGAGVYGFDFSATPQTRIPAEPDLQRNLSRSVSWTSDSRYLAVSQNGPSFLIFDASDSFATVYTSPPVDSPARVFRCVWSPDDRYLAVLYQRADQVGMPWLRVFDFDAGIAEPVEVTIPGIDVNLTVEGNDVDWGGPGGRYLVVSRAGSGGVAVWDWDSGTPVFVAGLSNTLSSAGSGGTRSVAFSPDPTNPRIAVAYASGDRLAVFTWPSPTTLARVDNALFAANTQRPVPLRGVSWSGNGRYLAVLSGESTDVPFTVYDLQSGVAVRAAPDPLPPLPALAAVALSDDGRYLVLGHGEGARFTYYPLALPYLLLFDYDSGTPVWVRQRLQGVGRVIDLAFSPDGDTLMVAGWSYDRFYPPTGVDNVRVEDGAGVNHVVNGSFEDTAGLERTSFGFTATGTLPGGFVDGAGGSMARVFLANRRFVNAFATDGSVYLDVVADGLGVVADDSRLRQNLEGLEEGETYRLSVDVTASLDSDIGLRLLWNGTPVSIEGQTTLPVIEDFTLLPVTVPPGTTLRVPLARHMLAYGDVLQAQASGAGVDCVVSYILSTQESVETLPEPSEPTDLDPESDPE